MKKTPSNIKSHKDKVPAMTLEFDNHKIEIHEMTRSYILSGDMEKINQRGKYGICTADRLLDPHTIAPNKYFSKIHEKLLRQYGTSAFIAWENKMVVGFINFHPEGIEFSRKPCLQRDYPDLVAKTTEILSGGSKYSLRIMCVSIAPGYRRNGLAKTLVNICSDWAKHHGYRELRILCPQKQWTIPPRVFWEKRGFAALKQYGSQVEMSKVL